MNDVVAAALKYAAMGWAVFPCNRHKRPFFGSHGLLEATTDPDAIKAAFAKHPGCNVAVRTGVISNLYVIDVDMSEGKQGDVALADLEREHGKLPDTLTQRTGRGGLQYFFEYPKDGGIYPNTESKIGLHIDTRGEGGYVVVPPSITVGQYEWTEDFAPEEVPAWLLPGLRRVAILPPELPAEPPADMPRAERLFAAWASKANTADGQRNKRAFVIACEGFGRGLPRSSIETVLADYCARSGLPWDEAVGCIESASTKPRNGNAPPEPTQEAMDAMGDWPSRKAVARVEPEAEPTDVIATEQGQEVEAEKGNKTHHALTAAIRRFFADGHLAIDAVGGWREKLTWKLTDFTIPRLANLFMMEYRERCKVSRSYVIETLETYADLWTNERRRAILSEFFGHPKTIDGIQLAQLWVHAVTGDMSEHDVAVMRHWMWCVKRKMAGKRVEHHIMPIIHGEQGSGKSEAVKRLLAPLQELWKICSASMLTDGREAHSLSTYFVGFWDEMEGVDKVAAEALKQTITADEKAYRPLHTNRDAVIPVRCSFIATTNEEVAGLVGDTTGGRRFYALPALKHCDWDTINSIDYAELWRSVDENEAAPILPHLKEIRARQHDLRKLDSVAMWLADEDGSSRSCHNRETGEKIRVGERPEAGETFETVRLRYLDWCARHGEKATGAGTFARRLAGERVPSHFPRVDGEPRRRRYFAWNAYRHGKGTK